MWLFTDGSTVSIVKKARGNTLTVRARRLEDLIRFRDEYLPELRNINQKATLVTDYPFRGTAPQAAVARAAAKAVAAICYSNYKTAAVAKQGAGVAGVLHGVWDKVRNLEAPDVRGRKWFGTLVHDDSPDKAWNKGRKKARQALWDNTVADSSGDAPGRHFGAD